MSPLSRRPPSFRVDSGKSEEKSGNPAAGVPEVSSNQNSLLFLAYWFPPANASGSVRTHNIAKHLSRLGWKVTVVTPAPQLFRHIDGEAEEELKVLFETGLVRRITTGHRWRFLAPDHLHTWNTGLGWLLGGLSRRAARAFSVDSGIGWRVPAQRACRDLTGREVDLILATGHPFTSFRIAERLARKWSCPFVLDYRDPWTGNPHSRNSGNSHQQHSEARFLGKAAAVTVVSPAWKKSLSERFDMEDKIEVITNGFDPDECSRVQPERFDHFAIVYGGTFYPPKRTITPILAALEHLRKSRGEGHWYLHYYGDHQSHVAEQAARFQLTHRVIFHNRVPRRDLLRAVRGSNVAVVITSVFEESSLEDEGIVPGKLFEILGLQAPLLLVSPRCSDARRVAGQAATAGSYTGKETEGISSYLGALLDGRVPPPPPATECSWPNLARKLDRVLRTALAGRRAGESRA